MPESVVCGAGPSQKAQHTKAVGHIPDVVVLAPVVNITGLPDAVQKIAVGVPIEIVGLETGGLKF